MSNEVNETKYLLAIDVGNSNITFGLMNDKEILYQWRIQTNLDKTSDEYGIELEQILTHFNYTIDSIEDVIIGSVVPDMMHTLPTMCQRFLKKQPIIVGEGTKTGIPIRLDNPKEVGADRIVNAVAGYEIYRGPLIIVDIGTAITHDVISSKGEYLGGAISPGIGIASDALFKGTAKLPKVELITPESAIGKNTIQAMQAGIVFGYIGLIDNITERLISDMEKIGENNPLVIATGGFSALLAQQSAYITKIDKDLTLQGLRLIYKRTITGR